MPIDFQAASYSRQYRHEQGDFRRLSIVTKAIAAYLRNLVDPTHGWLHLHGDKIHVAFRKHSSGSPTRSDQRLVARCVGELLTEGYLVQCRVAESEPCTFTTHDERDVPLSAWLADPAGDWVVIANWVPAQNGLTCDETNAWHAARRALFATSSSLPTLVGPEHDAPASQGLPVGLVEVRR